MFVLAPLHGSLFGIVCSMPKSRCRLIGFAQQIRGDGYDSGPRSAFMGSDKRNNGWPCQCLAADNTRNPAYVTFCLSGQILGFHDTPLLIPVERNRIVFLGFGGSLLASVSRHIRPRRQREFLPKGNYQRVHIGSSPIGFQCHALEGPRLSAFVIRSWQGRPSGRPAYPQAACSAFPSVRIA